MFGGRQSARTIHFIAASLIVLFVLVHVVMVLITGVWNNLRSMITGRYVIKYPKGEDMSEKSKLDRRGFVTRGLAAAGATLLGGCEGELSEQPWVKRILNSAETLTRVTQRALIPANALAREYEEADISARLQGQRLDRCRR